MVALTLTTIFVVTLVIGSQLRQVEQEVKLSDESTFSSDNENYQFNDFEDNRLAFLPRIFRPRRYRERPRANNQRPNTNRPNSDEGNKGEASKLDKPTSPNKPTPPAKPNTPEINESILGNNQTYFKSTGRDPGSSSSDLREFQHGLDFIKISPERYALIWSSSGNPPAGSNMVHWTHDIYYSFIDIKKPTISPKLLISKPEAQEPASAAISTSGNILITTEDGWDTPSVVDQRYALFNKDFQTIRSYPQLVLQGGHSGHVAFAGNHFVVFYSEGWVNGGGVDNLGSGRDVMAALISADGKLINSSIKVAVGNKTRDWWPLIAGSKDSALLLWQRCVPDKASVDLYFSVLDPETGALRPSQVKLESGVKYYTYSVSYVENINKFLVIGSYEKGGGFAHLIDPDGKWLGQTGVGADGFVIDESYLYTPSSATVNSASLQIYLIAGSTGHAYVDSVELFTAPTR